MYLALFFICPSRPDLNQDKLRRESVGLVMIQITFTIITYLYYLSHIANSICHAEFISGSLWLRDCRAPFHFARNGRRDNKIFTLSLYFAQDKWENKFR